METEGSLPQSQVSAICPYLEPDQSGPETVQRFAKRATKTDVDDLHLGGQGSIPLKSPVQKGACHGLSQTRLEGRDNVSTLWHLMLP
jgi:hypothetical protein